jgi:hypothetical protein
VNRWQPRLEPPAPLGGAAGVGVEHVLRINNYKQIMKLYFTKNNKIIRNTKYLAPQHYYPNEK